MYRSQESSTLRENYINEVYGFEDTIRESVIAKIVSSTFTRIGKERLETYLDLTGKYSEFGSPTALKVSARSNPEAYTTHPPCQVPISTLCLRSLAGLWMRKEVL